MCERVPVLLTVYVDALRPIVAARGERYQRDHCEDDHQAEKCLHTYPDTAAKVTV